MDELRFIINLSNWIDRRAIIVLIEDYCDGEFKHHRLDSEHEQVQKRVEEILHWVG